MHHAVDLRANAAAGQRLLMLRRWNHLLLALRFRDYRPRQRMAGALLNGGREAKQLLLCIRAKRLHVGNLRFTGGQGAGFIKRQRLHPAEAFERRAAFNQRALASRRRQAGSDSGRRGDHQRARTANQQQRQPFVDPRQPGA